MSRIFESGRLQLRQTGQLRGKAFFTDHRYFGFELGKFVAAEKFSFFRDHLDFWHELGKFRSDSK